jgi:hypothetical protein
MEIIVMLLLVGLFVMYSSFSWGFVASKFYGWFILTSFPTLPQFTVLQFVGFLLFVGVMTHKSSTFIKEEYKDTTTEFTLLLFSPWVSLIIGWMVYGIFF